MKPVKLIANSQTSLAECLGCAGKLWREHKYMKMTLSFGRDRSLEQNRLLHKWFTEIADQRAEHTAAEIKVICKRQFFIPVLRGEDEAFNDILNSLVGMSEEQKNALVELLPVTSICTIKQMSTCMDQIFMHYTGLGVELTQPENDELHKQGDDK